MAVLEEHQGSDLQQAAKDLNDASRQAEESREQRQTPVDRLKQSVEEGGQRDVDRVRDQADGEARPIRGAMRQDGVRGGRGIARNHESSGEECAGERRHEIEQIDDADGSRMRARSALHAAALGGASLAALLASEALDD